MTPAEDMIVIPVRVRRGNLSALEIGVDLDGIYLVPEYDGTYQLALRPNRRTRLPVGGMVCVPGHCECGPLRRVWRQLRGAA